MTLMLAILTFIVFLWLKALGHIDWNMWAVSAPLWLWLTAGILVSVEAVFWRFLNSRYRS